MDSQAPSSDYSLDNLSVMIAFFTIPPLFFFIVFVITHCYQRLRHGSDLDPELPDLEGGQVSLAHPSPPSTTAADHNRHNLGQFRNKIGTHRLMLPVDKDYDSSTTNIRECAICLEEFRAGETCRVLLVCDHFFHPECIGLWLVENQTCPICRREG
ncbi:E3 ubiquitin-protein like [Actinidia chinensis var. chinensis]|uniref:RING-type E3 ubiquitin transferase n=1 Tax=Actinidia chinensis var. chinensis TaxID=1590841 RepID=A0A2R6QWS1_ACTCC|nr:E3 ubiquitin-protein like [Actinidia chinensis var. chinensis]